MSLMRDRLKKKYQAQNRLNAVMIETTHRCPCRCIHCYIPEYKKGELSLKEYRRLFEELKDEGVFDLGFTGGEPFMHRDMWKILKAASDIGFFISILSTTLLWKPKDVQRLKKLKIQGVETSLLGGDAETHDRLMNYPGAFDHLNTMIPLLVEAGITVTVKASLLKQNYHQIDAMENLGKKWKVDFSALATICVKLDGSTTPQNHALEKEELKKIPLKYIIGKDDLLDASSKAFLTCNGGNIFAAVDPFGEVYPCLMLRKSIGNIKDRSIQDMWHKNPDPLLNRMRTLKEEDSKDCIECEHITYCNRCPATSYLETGSVIKKTPSACRQCEQLKGIMKKQESY